MQQGTRETNYRLSQKSAINPGDQDTHRKHEPVMYDADDSLSPITVKKTMEPNVQFKGSTGILNMLPPGHVPAYRAVFLIANAALGAGLLNFPQAFMKAGGVKVAISVQFTLLFFIIGAFVILARCANHSQAATYQDVILFMLGRRVHNVTQVLIGIYFFGSAITYIIIIGEQLSSVAKYAFGKTLVWYVDKRLCQSIFALMFLLPLCIPRRLKALSYTSFFGGIGAFFIAFVIIYRHFGGHYRIHITPVEESNAAEAYDWKSAFEALPVICFGFQCHVSSVAVYAELKNRSTKKFFLCAMVAMIVCVTVYSLSGSFGYQTFGSHTKSDILENYDENDIFVVVARIAIVFILLSSFSIVSFCARTVIDGIYLNVRNIGVIEAERTERVRRIIETLCWFVAAMLLAVVVPNIGVAIDMIAGVASTFIFTFPGLCLLQTVDLKKRKLSKKEILTVLVACLYLVIGLFIFGEVTTLAIQQQITGRQLQ